jgi:hypothetical protein
MWEEVNPIL